MLNRIWVLMLLAMVASCAERGEVPPGLESRAEMKTAVQHQADRSAQSILAAAHKAAGGETWSKPKQLKLSGYNLIRNDDKEVVWDRYTMWRVYADEKKDAHQADGKVRIEAWSGEELAMLLTFDGEKSYNQDGPLSNQSANHVWGNNFGFGAIRNGLDEGWTQKRLPDDMVDGQSAYMIELTDPSGGKSLFGIRQSDHAVVYAGFQTRRGWHERRYSHFFRKSGSDWRQPGRVRLFYNGVKSNEAVWLDFELDGEWSDDLFRVEAK